VSLSKGELTRSNIEGKHDQLTCHDDVILCICYSDAFRLCQENGSRRLSLGSSEMFIVVSFLFARNSTANKHEQKLSSSTSRAANERRRLRMRSVFSDLLSSRPVIFFTSLNADI